WLSDRQQALLGALAEDAKLLGLEVEGIAFEVDDLLAAQAAGVRELEHRPVAQLQRSSCGDLLEQVTHLLAGQHPRQLFLPLGAGDKICRVLPNPLGADEKVEQTAHRGKLAGNGRRSGATRGEPSAEAPHVAMSNLARPDPPLLGP